MSGVALLAGAGALAFFLLNQEDEKRKKIDYLKGYTHLLPGVNDSGYKANLGVIDDNPTCPPGTDLNPNDGLCYPPFNPCAEFPGTVLNKEGNKCLPPGGNPNTGESEDSMDAVCAEEFGEGYTFKKETGNCYPPPSNPCAGLGSQGEDLEYWPKEEGGDGMCHYPDGQPPECPVGHVWRKDDKGEYRCMRGHALDIGLSSQHLAVQIVAETALSYVAGTAIDYAARGAYRGVTAAGRAAQNAAANAAVNAAGQAATRAAGAGTLAGANAGRAAREAARAAQESARAAQQAAQAARAAQAAARTTRFSLMMARMAGTPFGLIFMIIAQILIAVLGLNPDEFENCKNGEIDLSALPDWARILIESVPFAGDLFSMISPTICIRTGCEPPNVEQHGLCYPPPRDNFWCDAFLCYSQHPAWQNNGQLHTTTHITKSIPLDTGTIPLSCPDGARLDGLLCYNVPGWGKGEGNPGVNIVAGVAWENCRPGMTDTGVRCEDVRGGGVGVGRDCPAGWTTEPLTCREPIHTHTDPCPYGWQDIAGTCWGYAGGGNCVGGCGGGCHVGCCGCKWRTPNTWGIRRQLHERGMRTTGGRIEGRGAGSSLPCPANTSVGWDGLCYENCPEGFRREGLLCSRSYDKRSEVLAPFSPSCPADRIDGASFGSAGLCYMNPLPEGFRRVVAGTIEQICPTSPPEWGAVEENVLDIGVACQRARYNRGAGTVPFGIRVKARRQAQAPPPPPPSCEERRAIFRNLDEKGQLAHQAVPCIEAPCAEDEDITGDGLICVPRCRPGYRSITRGISDSEEVQVWCARDATADAPADEYLQRPNRPIDFGFE